MGALSKLGILAGISYAGYRLVNHFSNGQTNGSMSNHAITPAGGTMGAVRDAGPEELHGINNKDWDMVDQQSDESFSASDAPGNY